MKLEIRDMKRNLKGDFHNVSYPPKSGIETERPFLSNREEFKVESCFTRAKEKEIQNGLHNHSRLLVK